MEPREAMHAIDTLLQVAREVGEPLPLDDLLARVEQGARRALECERVTVFLLDRARGELYSRFATGAEEIRIPAHKGIAGRTFSDGRVINVPDVANHPDFYSEVDRRTGFRTRSLLSVPLAGFDSSIVGVLEIVNKLEGTFTVGDEEMATALASLTGVALQRQLLLESHKESQRREDEFKRARHVQRSLLPETPPELRHYEIAGWSEPVYDAGGDFYDYLTLPDGRTCVVVADVAGHGLESALVACEARALVRALAAETSDLEVIVRQTNRILSSDLRNEGFVIMFIGALNERSGHMDYACAGCVALVYRHATGAIDDLTATTLPLAIFPEFEEPPCGSTSIARGDAVTLVTDGIFEWSSAGGEPFGLERVRGVMREHGALGAPELIRALRTEAETFATVPATDDTTAIVLKRLR